MWSLRLLFCKISFASTIATSWPFRSIACWPRHGITEALHVGQLRSGRRPRRFSLRWALENVACTAAVLADGSTRAPGGKGANLRGVRRWRVLMMRMIFVLCALCLRTQKIYHAFPWPKVLMVAFLPIGTWGRVHGNLQQNLTLIGWFKLYSNYSISLVGKRQKMKEGWKWNRDLPVRPVLLKKPARFGSCFSCYVLAYCGHWRAVFLGFLAWKKCDLRMMDGVVFPTAIFGALWISRKCQNFGSSLVWSDNGFKCGWAIPDQKPPNIWPSS